MSPSNQCGIRERIDGINCLFVCTCCCGWGGETEKPRSAAMERASDMPPMRLRGFLPTQLDSLPIDIFQFPTNTTSFSKVQMNPPKKK